MNKGVPVSPGVVVARAYCVDEALARQEPGHVEAAAAAAEVTRFDKAVSRSAAQTWKPPRRWQSASCT